jgi:hypothetical protein
MKEILFRLITLPIAILNAAVIFIDLIVLHLRFGERSYSIFINRAYAKLSNNEYLKKKK